MAKVKELWFKVAKIRKRAQSCMYREVQRKSKPLAWLSLWLSNVIQVPLSVPLSAALTEAGPLLVATRWLPVTNNCLLFTYIRRQYIFQPRNMNPQLTSFIARPQDKGVTLVVWNQGFSKLSPQISSLSFWEPGNLLEMQIVSLHSSSNEWEMLRVRSSNLSFNQFPMYSALDLIEFTPSNGGRVDTWAKLGLC